MLSYAGMYLSEPEGTDVAAWVAENIRPAELFPLAAKFWPGTITGGPILDQTAWPYRPVTIGTLYWPWGASRFAHGHFVVSEAQINAIRSAAGTPAPQTQPFVMDDGTNRITTKLWMLPALPLSSLKTGVAGAPGGAGLWLLTLVDDRYWWWDRAFEFSIQSAGAGGPIVPLDGPTTSAWTDIYTAIGAALGVSIQVDPIPTAYGMPTVDYSCTYRPLPQYFDAVAFSVGQRVVRTLDGTVHAQNYATAAANSASQAPTYAPLKYAGGGLALTAGV